MDRFGKGKQRKVSYEVEGHQQSKKSKCSVCQKHFKSRSHFDAICDLCWADNEMRPFLSFGGLRGVRFVQ